MIQILMAKPKIVEMAGQDTAVEKYTKRKDETYLCVVEKHVVVSKDGVLDRQPILNTVSNNKCTVGWLSKMYVVLFGTKIPFL